MQQLCTVPGAASTQLARGRVSKKNPVLQILGTYALIAQLLLLITKVQRNWQPVPFPSLLQAPPPLAQETSRKFKGLVPFPPADIPEQTVQTHHKITTVPKNYKTWANIMTRNWRYTWTLEGGAAWETWIKACKERFIDTVALSSDSRVNLSRDLEAFLICFWQDSGKTWCGRFCSLGSIGPRV